MTDNVLADVIGALSTNLGFAVWYIAVADENAAKEIEALEKAVACIQREIERLPDNKEMLFFPDHLPVILSGHMRINRGSAVKAVCLGDTKSLNDALGYLGMEIEELKK